MFYLNYSQMNLMWHERQIDETGMSDFLQNIGPLYLTLYGIYKFPTLNTTLK